jgi:hypothetical protein
MSTWQQDLVGKFVWATQLGVMGVVAKAHGPGEYADARGRKVTAPVLELEDGQSCVADDARQRDFEPMSKSAALLMELGTRVVADATRLLADHARAYGLAPKVSALVVSTVLAGQARILKQLADRKEVADGEPKPAG